MVKPLPPGCRLTAIYDSCHSGSVLDLPHLYTLGKDSGVLYSKSHHAVLAKASQADVVCWSACEDSEMAMDVKKTGAMTGAFMSALNQGHAHSYQSLFLAIHEIIRADPNLGQRPQLSTSHPMVGVRTRRSMVWTANVSRRILRGCSPYEKPRLSPASAGR